MTGADLRPRILMERDAEGALGPSAVPPQDPFQLRMGLLSDEQIAGLRRRKKGKVVAEYQKKQNNLVNYMLKPMENHTEESKVDEEAARLPVKNCCVCESSWQFCIGCRSTLGCYNGIVPLSVGDRHRFLV